jgi:hypothetical protein
LSLRLKNIEAPAREQRTHGSCVTNADRPKSELRTLMAA